MVKKVLLCFMLGVATISSGCGKQVSSEKMINTFVQKGFHTIGALKTNRLLYPSGMKKKLSELFCRIISNREWI